MKKSLNIEMIQLVAQKLGPLKNQVVFVGGSTVALYIDDEFAPEPIPSEDVDCLIEATTYGDYEKFSAEVRKLGFSDVDPTGRDEQPPICRKYYGKISVDFMPPDDSILGFSNPWYEEGLKHKIKTTLPDGIEINILSLGHFLATKLTAYESRGKAGGDPRFSQDLEDISQVFDGRKNIEAEIAGLKGEIKTYIDSVIGYFLANKNIYREAFGCFLDYEKPAERVDRIFGVFERIVS